MSGYIGTQPVPQATQTRDSFTATSGQTSFATSGYTPNFLDVFLNGVKLAAADYTATNGSDVVLASGASTGDILEVVAYTTFEASNVTGATNFTVTGAFTSQGIDDNGNATALTIDSSENVLIGKTAAGIANAGSELSSDGRAFFTFDNGGPLQLNRLTGDGDIIELHKDGTEVGSIGTNGSTLYIGSTEGADAYLGFGNQIIRPVTSSGASRDNAIDLGYNGMRFRDAYLSGGIYLGGVAAANKLEDYEEGTFTVGFQGATVSANNTTALYTKIGDLVTWYWYSSDTAISSASGAAYLTGLPFTVLNTNNNYNPVLIAHNTYFGGSTSIGQQAYHLVGNDKVVFNTIGQANNPAFVNGSGKFLMIQGSYKTAS